VRRLDEPPKPRGFVGRPWAIAAGCAVARGEWVLIVDADTAPRPGMVGGAVAAARRLALDVVSLAPRIVAPGAGARWLQPAFLATLVYRFGPPGVDPPDPERAMANGAVPAHPPRPARARRRLRRRGALVLRRHQHR